MPGTLMPLNRAAFYSHIRAKPFGGHLTQGQVDGTEAILDGWEAGYATRDQRWLAYALATAYHETDRTMQPIEEYGKGRGRPYGKRDPEMGQAYYGRGLVQLTWRANYAKMGKLLLTDLVRHPELALRPDLAVRIMFEGMIRGTFTGKKLADYFTPSHTDPVGARRIINGQDKAGMIAGYHNQFLAALRAA